MTNDEEKEVLELELAGKFIAFAQALRDQEAAKGAQLEAKVAMMVDAVKHVLPTLHADPRCPSEVTDRLEQAVAATQPTADEFVARIKAEALEEAAKSEFMQSAHVAEYFEGDVSEAASVVLNRMAAELHNAKEVHDDQLHL